MKTALTTMMPLLTLFFLSVQGSLGSYSLSTRQCQYAVKTIGKILNTRNTPEGFLKGTFVSPRCEWRRIQNLQGGLKTAFFLRSMEIANRRRWTGNYFYYRDQDCIQPTYGLKIQGQFGIKNKKLVTFNISSVSIAIYNTENKKEIEAKYNKSCPGHLTRSGSRIPLVYTTDSKVSSSKSCLRALGLDKNEFTDAYYERHKPSGLRTDEIVQKAADLRKVIKHSVLDIEQPPLVRHNTRMCLTCVKMGLATLTHPPKLNKRNATSLDGVWGTFRCKKEGRSVYSTRIDKFDGKNFESAFYIMDHTGLPKCESAVFELRTSGTFRKIGRSAEVPGGIVYEMMTKHAFLTPYTASYTSIFNVDTKTCGSKTWERGNTQDLVPTKGCQSIGYSVNVNQPELILIRTVHDENRNEMYFGTDSSGQNKKSGPVEYNYITQDCTTFPIEMTTTPGPTETTTIETTSTTSESNEEDSETVEEVIKKVYQPTSAASPMNTMLQTVVFCLVIFIQAVRLA